MPEKIRLEKVANVGTSEPFMSRIWHLNVIKDGVIASNKQSVSDAIMDTIFEGLLPAFTALEQLEKLMSDPKSAANEREKLAKDVVNYICIAYKDRLQSVTLSLGYDIGFLFKKDSAFEQESENFLYRHPKIRRGFVDAMKRDREAWQETLFTIRDHLIWHKKGKDKKEVKKLEKYLNSKDLRQLFNKCWLAIEEIIAVLIDDLMDDKYKMRLLHVKEYTDPLLSLKRFSWFDVSK